VTDGKAALYAHDILTARTKFQQAVAEDSTDQEAQFLYAVTRIAAVYEDGKDLHTPALDSVKEILELSGVTFITFGLYNSDGTASHGLPSTTPRTGAALDYLKTKLLPEVNGALAGLALVTDHSFSCDLAQDALNRVGANLNVDYGDTRVVAAGVYALKAYLELFLAYDLDVNMPPVVNNDLNDLLNFRHALTWNPTLLTSKEPARLDTAKGALTVSIDSMNDAVTFIKNNRSVPAGHAFVIDVAITNELVSETTSNINDLQTGLGEFKASLSGPTTFSNSINKGMPAPQRTFDFSKLFNSAHPLNIRNLFSDAHGDMAQTDVTWGGIAPYGGLELYENLIWLPPGWNLISLPVIPADLSIASVLAPIYGKYLGVWGYDQTNGWTVYRPGASGNTLTAFEAGKGYWIYITDTTVLNLQGASAPRQLALKQGWNLVGYSDAVEYYRDVDRGVSNTPGVQMVWGYRRGSEWTGYSPLFNLPGYTRPRLTQSRGYWIKAANDTTLDPPPFELTESNGYEVYGGGPYSPANAKDVIKNPARFGYTLVGRARVSDADYTAKSFILDNQYTYFVVKMTNPVGAPVKIDTITLNGQCFSPSSYWGHNLDYEFSLWWWGFGPCNDGYFATMTDNGGFLNSASGVGYITVYGVR
jgi:hypothetical protein